MRESVFTTELKNSFQAYGAFAYKISDLPHYKGMKTRFDSGKPCDLVVGYRGYFIGVENKMMKKPGSFGLKDMRPAQVEGLTEMIVTGNDAYVFLNLRMPAGTYKKMHYPRLDKILIFDWVNFSRLKRNYTFEMILYASTTAFEKVTMHKQRVYNLVPFLNTYVTETL